MDILLVDDDETLRLSLNMLLQSEDYSVQLACTGEEALEKAREHYFDLVLCDVRMPGMDGLEAIEKLKPLVESAHFIVMTGYASEDAPIKALRLGVDDYLTKPFDIPLFLEKLRGIARHRRASAQHQSTSLWGFLESLKEHFPGHAARCESVQEKALAWASSLELESDQRELLRLGSWLFPLAEGASQEGEGQEDPDTLTDRLARLLADLNRSGQGETPDLLRAARALSQGQALPTDLAPKVEELAGAEAPDAGTDSAASDSSLPLEVATLGRFEVRIQGEPVERKAWQSAKARWLFVYLLSRGGQSVPEDRLAEQFWPGSPQKKAHRALVSSVHRARTALKDPEMIARYDRSYGINRELEYRLDSEELLDAYRAGTRYYYQKSFPQAQEKLLKVMELYQGEFIPQCDDSWCVRIREDLKLKVVDAAEKCAELLLNDDPSRSEALARRALTLEKTSEPAWSGLFKALAAQGRRSEVEQAFQECTEVLMEELSLKPGASLRESYEQAMQ